MSKLIIIAGIKRSRSTWMYNAVRLCLEHAGCSVHIAGDGQYYEKDCETDYQIIKVHPFHQWMADEADFVFTSNRDDEGIRGSWKRFKGEELTDAKLRMWQGWLQRWREYSCYHMEWNVFLDRPGIVITDIWRAMLYPEHDTFSLSDVWNAIADCTPPTDKDYDPVTLLFSNHITSQ